MDPDDDYASFVADKWAAEAIPLNGVTVERGHSIPYRVSGELVGLVIGEQERLYVNVREGGLRKTYRPEMHRWWRDGQPIHGSAFDGIRLGADPDAVLRPEIPARSVEDAMSPAFDRFACSDPSWVLEHRHPDHGPMFEVISKVIRSSGKFTARSHFRFGHRESFDHEDVRQVLALPSLAVEPFERFFNRGRRR